jgi:hypothetical protein
VLDAVFIQHRRIPIAQRAWIIESAGPRPQDVLGIVVKIKQVTSISERRSGLADRITQDTQTATSSLFLAAEHRRLTGLSWEGWLPASTSRIVENLGYSTH